MQHRRCLSHQRGQLLLRLVINKDNWSCCWCSCKTNMHVAPYSTHVRLLFPMLLPLLLVQKPHHACVSVQFRAVMCPIARSGTAAALLLCCCRCLQLLLLLLVQEPRQACTSVQLRSVLCRLTHQCLLLCCFAAAIDCSCAAAAAASAAAAPRMC
jgi:hypothetical protein